ncbi:MAG: sulfatase-like hydrolase/transferase [bacterium]|nr:sulfatase-like hydrolase/transferase [bacterium]
MAGDLEFQVPKEAEARFKQLVTDTPLAKHIKRNHVNIYQKKNPWIGRVRDREVCYHALFSIDDTKIISTSSNPGTGTIVFSIYHPEQSQLTYTLHLETAGKKETLFEKNFKEKAFYDGTITMDKKIAGDFKLIFETRGKGIGAWLNPRFNEVKKKPRVIMMIMVDTLRSDHTSVYGYHRKTTPRLDKLAADGVVFKNAFSTTSWTLPAHVSLFSGKDLSEHGVVSPGDFITYDYPLLAEALQAQGFVTAAFTGGGFVEDSFGFFRGFQYYSNAPGNVFSMNSADRVFNHFKNYINRFLGNDLFIFLHTYQVHSPYKAPRRYIDRIDKNIKGNLLGIPNFIKNKHEYFKPIEEEKRKLLINLYDASILYTDEVLIGNTIDFLKEKGYYEDAMITVLSDHGEEFYEHGSWEHGHSVYNELIQIPLVMKYPAGTKNTQKGLENSLTSISDVPGIILKTAGYPDYTETDFKIKIGDPNRILPVLFPESPIIKEFPSKISFVDKDFHFIYNDPDKEKLKFFNPQPRKQKLYELYKRSDDAEKNNVFKKNTHLLKKYQQLVKSYLKKLQKVKQSKKSNRNIDKDLQKKLESLGYLGGKKD